MSTGSLNSEPVSRTGSSSSQEGQPSRPSSRTGRSSSSGQSLSKATWRSFELFQELSQDDFTPCIKMMKVCTFKPGEKIITKGTIGTTMYFIDVGSARASIQGLTANELKSGDYFGKLFLESSAGRPSLPWSLIHFTIFLNCRRNLFRCNVQKLLAREIR